MIELKTRILGEGLSTAQLTPSLIVVSRTSYPADNTSRTMRLFGSNFVSSDTLSFIWPDGIARQASHAISFVSSNEIDYSFNDAGDAGNWSVRVNTADGTLHSGSQSSAVATAELTPSLSSVSPTSYAGDTNNHTTQMFGANFQTGDTLTFAAVSRTILNQWAGTASACCTDVRIATSPMSFSNVGIDSLRAARGQRRWECRPRGVPKLAAPKIPKRTMFGSSPTTIRRN